MGGGQDLGVSGVRGAEPVGRAGSRAKPGSAAAQRRHSRFLSTDEMRTVAREFEATVSYLSGRRRAEPLAGLIQYPKLPERLTESIAAALLESGLVHLPGVGAVETVLPGGRESDILLIGDGQPFRIEVKATTRGWTAVNPKDLTADFLIWLDLERDFVSVGRARVIVVRTMGQLGYEHAKRVTTVALRRDHGGAISEQVVSLATILD
jgi:hypothetical protein